MIGAQTSRQQFDKILGYVQIGKDEGAEVLMSGSRYFCESLPEDSCPRKQQKSRDH
jgi:aldehyde dehydrogenase